MSGTDITEAVLSAGQNEGVERSVLPLPQLSYVQNARQRKSGRWGKRFGTSALSGVNNSNAVLGIAGNGNIRTIGNGFVIVDDQCAIYDQQTTKWIDPKAIAGVNTTNPICQSPRVPGAVSGWLPDTAFFPVPPRSPQFQQLTPCAQTYGLGYLWSAIQFIDENNLGQPDSVIRVSAINPTDQSLVFVQDLAAGTAGQGGNIYPKLITCGSTIIIAYITRPSNAAAFVAARRLTALASGFGAEVSVVAFGGIALPTSSYDASGYSSTQFLMAVGPGVTTAYLIDSTTLAVVTSKAGPAHGSNGLSIVGASGGPVYMVTSSAGLTEVTVFTASLAAVTGTVTIDGAEPATYTAHCTLLPAGGVRCSFGYFGDVGAVPRHFSWRDVTAAATVASALVGRQYRYQPISRPFTVGTEVYQWVTNPDTAAGFGFATLLRLPALTEFQTLSGTVNYLSCPLEMCPQDFLIRSKKPGIFVTNPATPPLQAGLAEQANGLPAVTQIGTSATYSFLAPTLLNVPDITIPFFHEFRAIQTTHFTDSAGKRSVNALTTDRSNFLPGGALARIDQRGCAEEGFPLVPVILPPITKSGTGGALSPSVTYQYTAVYKSTSQSGRFEVSAPGPVASVTMGPGDSTTFPTFLPCMVSARASIQIEVYRTLGNGSIFYLVDTINGGASSGATIGYQDVLADSVISGHRVLYVQVGQTLPNTFPPPSRFAVAGGQRVILGGLLRGDVAHASKLILGDQSPSWADSDAFRIVMPGVLTGLAWMDNLVLFTSEGVYVVSGDGPDDSGNGDFSPPVRLPFTLGCIEPRSVISVDEGTFFQTSRTIYMLPRGFGSPVPAGDVVMDTLALYPIITGVAALIKPTEQTIRWSCVDTASATNGVMIIYDLVHKCWSVDQVTDPVTANVTAAHVSVSGWINGEIAMAEKAVSFSLPLKNTASTFDDSGAAIAMTLRTGDLRPFGAMSEGVFSKVNTMGELRSACTLNVTKVTEWGTSPAAPRVFTLAAGDTQVGQITYVETELGNAELRDAASLRIQWDESSATEGVAVIAVALEHEQGEGLKRVSPLSRAT